MVTRQLGDSATWQLGNSVLVTLLGKVSVPVLGGVLVPVLVLAEVLALVPGFGDVLDPCEADLGVKYVRRLAVEARLWEL